MAQIGSFGTIEQALGYKPSSQQKAVQQQLQAEKEHQTNWSSGTASQGMVGNWQDQPQTGPDLDGQDQQGYQGGQHACPACGYCPHCGRGGYNPQPFYVPNLPYYWVSPQPYYDHFVPTCNNIGIAEQYQYNQ